jgi:hypothetical protein
MTDPGGGFGWRAGSNPYSLKRIAERAERGGPEPMPIAVLLLPGELEQFALREQAEDLMSAPGVVAVEPARVSYGAYLRLPAAVADGIAATQARRMKLPGVPRAIVLYDALQYPLARGLIAQHPDAELWYWQTSDEHPEATSRRRLARLEELHLAASLRAALVIDAPDTGETPRLELPAAATAHKRNGPLWERLEALGIESGRLGSERASVVAPGSTAPGARRRPARGGDR